MGVRWRILATLFVLPIVFSACPDQFKNVPCQCDEQLFDGALIVGCYQANLPVVMSILGSDPATVVSKLAFRDSPIPTLRSQDLGSVNIRSLEISNCNLTTIEAGAFRGLADELEELVLANNSLSKWPPLGNLGKLKTINLNGNALTDVSENAFVGMPNLQQLWLGHNQICQLSPNALSETKASLEILDLSDNCLSAVPTQNLRDASRLQYLDLSSNRISDVQIMQFMNLPQLKEVRLNGNAITQLSAMAFMNVPELNYLFLRDNRISTLGESRFSQFRNLEVLDLTGNLISSVPTASFKAMNNLKQLFLDDNLIERIDPLAFIADPQLRIISLQSNRLKTLSPSAFDSLDRMVTLLLANNSLTDLDRGMFDGMHNLQLLNLRNNSLSRIGDGSFDAVPLLTSLDLAYNKLALIHPSTFSSLKDLSTLDLSNNRLQTLTEGTFQSKIANILLGNNSLVCDDRLDWFVRYLVQNNVRTSLTNQQEVLCAAPQEYAGVRLEELLFRKTVPILGSIAPTFPSLLPIDRLENPGLNKGIAQFSGPLMVEDGSRSSLQSDMNRLFQSDPNPGVGGADISKVQHQHAPILGSIAPTIPSLLQIDRSGNPGLSNAFAQFFGSPMAQDTYRSPLSMDRRENPALNNAISQFFGPRTVEDGSRSPMKFDMNQLIQTVPNMLVNSGVGVGNVDISKFPPGVITHLLQGGNIPGMRQDAVNSLVQQHLQRMAATARAAELGHVNEMTSKVLPPLSSLDPSVVTVLMRSERLPGLSIDDTNAIKQYYSQPPPPMRVEAVQMPAPTKNSKMNFDVPADIPSPDLMKLFPPGFDFSRLPPAIPEEQSSDLSLLSDELLNESRFLPAILEQASNGQSPDLSFLSSELLNELRQTYPEPTTTTTAKKPQETTEKIQRSKPTRSPEVPTYKPNDVDEFAKAQLKAQQDQEHMAQLVKAQLKAQQDQEHMAQLAVAQLKAQQDQEHMAQLAKAQLKAQQDQEYMAQFGNAQLNAQRDQGYLTPEFGIAIGVGIVGALALVILGVMCYRWFRHSNERDLNNLTSQTKQEPCPPYSFNVTYK